MQKNTRLKRIKDQVGFLLRLFVGELFCWLPTANSLTGLTVPGLGGSFVHEKKGKELLMGCSVRPSDCSEGKEVFFFRSGEGRR